MGGSSFCFTIPIPYGIATPACGVVRDDIPSGWNGTRAVFCIGDP